MVSLESSLNSITLKRFLRFLVVGTGNTAFGYAVFVVAYLAFDSYRVAIVLATIIGILFNFVTTGFIVFGNRSGRPFFAFVAGYVVICVANISFMEGLVRLGLNPLLAQLLVLPVLAVMAFAMNDRLVFRRAT